MKNLFVFLLMLYGNQSDKWGLKVFEVNKKY